VGVKVAILNNEGKKKRAEQEVMERGRITPFGREPPVALN